MKILILNVDRDNDFGRKANIKSPIIGLAKNIEAANKLGQTDPEDSDLNAIFYAINTYNILKKENKNVEIATVCGDIKVGLKSDEIISKQVEKVIQETGADEAVLITDGAEDEYILPIVQSRIKITSINRVSVKQSRELEDAYYRFLKIMEDEKVQKQFLLPIALVLIVWAFFVLINMAASGFGAILLTLGVYLLVRVFRWEKKIEFLWEEIKSGFLTGKLSIPAYILALVLLIAFVFIAYYNVNTSLNPQHLQILSFIKIVIWGFVIAGIIAVFGRAIDIHVKDQKTPANYFMAPFSFLTLGFIVFAVSDALYWALINWPDTFHIDPFLSLNFFSFTIAGIMMALLGAVTYRYIKETHPASENENEQKTTTIKNQ